MPDADPRPLPDAPARYDAVDGIVHAMVEIAAPPERVFTALTDPRQLGVWWGSADTYLTHDWRVDLRPGGAWSVRTTSVRGEMTVHGEYLTIEPPRLLEYTWRFGGDAVHPTTIRCELAAVMVDGVSGTRLTVTHAGFAGRPEVGRNHTVGWNRVLGWLVAHLARGAE